MERGGPYYKTTSHDISFMYNPAKEGKRRKAKERKNEGKKERQNGQLKKKKKCQCCKKWPDSYKEKNNLCCVEALKSSSPKRCY